MSWNSKISNAEYIIVKHKLPDVNSIISGIKFRGGYGVVIKDSKTYASLKRLPLLKGNEDLPLIHLRQLKFITRSQDVLTIYGKDIYTAYMKALNETLDTEAHEAHAKAEAAHMLSDKCKFRTKLGTLCVNEVHEKSPMEHCTFHLVEDIKLLELMNLKPNKIMTKTEKSEFKIKFYKKLEKVPKYKIKEALEEWEQNQTDPQEAKLPLEE